MKAHTTLIYTPKTICLIIMYSCLVHLATAQTISEIKAIPQNVADTLLAAHPEADSTIQKIDGKVEGVEDHISKINHTTDTLSQKLDVESKVNGKLQSIEDNVKQKINEVKPVQDTQSALDNIEQETGLSTPQGVAPEIPGVDITGNKLPNIDLPTDKLQQVKALPQKGIEQVKSLHGIEEAGEQLGQVKDAAGKAATYQKDMEAIQQGKLPEAGNIEQTIEQKVQSTKYMQELQKQQQGINQAQQVKDQVDQYKDKDFLKAQAKQKLIAKSKDHFSHHTEELKTAQEKLSKLKNKYSHVNQQTGEMVKRSSLKGQPFKERITWGTTLQINEGPPTNFDLSPFIGYRFSKRWSSGIGGTYRFAFNGKNRFIPGYSVYGVRIYGECRPYKKFLLHGEYERLHAYIPNQALTTIDTEQQWIEGILAGTGKTYHVTKKIKGNVMLLRNFTYVKQGPYLLKWNVRFSFYF